MTIRLFEPSDIRPLCRLYNSLATRIPSQPLVEEEQFGRQLGTTIWQEWPAYFRSMPRGVFLPEGELALVATEGRGPVAFACGAFLQEAGEFLPARTGLIRFAFAGPRDLDACRALIHALVDHSRKRHPDQIFGLHYSHGPVFHNFCSALLPTAWSWVGQSFAQEGFEPIVDRYSMRRRIDGAPEPLTLPAGAEMRSEVGIEAREGQYEFHHRLYIADEQAAECECYFAEKVVSGSNRRTLYIAELFVREPYRGQGLGRFLVRDALKAAREAGTVEVILRTEVDNFPALSLYQSERFLLVDSLCWFRLRI